MNTITKTFLDAYQSVPGQSQGFRTGDILVFLLVYIAWYLLVSLVYYLFYSTRRTLLAKKLDKSFSETHGMLSLGDDDAEQNPTDPNRAE